MRKRASRGKAAEFKSTKDYKALEAAYLEMKSMNQRSIAFGEMLQCDLQQASLGNKTLVAKLDEWERDGKGSSTLTEKLDRQASDVSQLKKRIESSESRVRQLEIENLELIQKQDSLKEKYEYAQECVQLYRADCEAFQKDLYKAREDLEKQKKFSKEEQKSNKMPLQLLNRELVSKNAELNKVRKTKCSPNTPSTAQKQCADTLGLEWGASAGL